MKLQLGTPEREMRNEMPFAKHFKFALRLTKNVSHDVPRIPFPIALRGPAWRDERHALVTAVLVVKIAVAM
jgi:hypothetical protein